MNTFSSTNLPSSYSTFSDFLNSQQLSLVIWLPFYVCLWIINFFWCCHTDSAIHTFNFVFHRSLRTKELNCERYGIRSVMTSIVEDRYERFGETCCLQLLNKSHQNGDSRPIRNAGTGLHDVTRQKTVIFGVTTVRKSKLILQKPWREKSSRFSQVLTLLILREVPFRNTVEISITFAEVFIYISVSESQILGQYLKKQQLLATYLPI